MPNFKNKKIKKDLKEIWNKQLNRNRWTLWQKPKEQWVVWIQEKWNIKKSWKPNPKHHISMLFRHRHGEKQEWKQ